MDTSPILASPGLFSMTGILVLIAPEHAPGHPRRNRKLLAVRPGPRLQQTIKPEKYDSITFVWLRTWQKIRD